MKEYNEEYYNEPDIPLARTLCFCDAKHIDIDSPIGHVYYEFSGDAEMDQILDAKIKDPNDKERMRKELKKLNGEKRRKALTRLRDTSLKIIDSFLTVGAYTALAGSLLGGVIGIFKGRPISGFKKGMALGGVLGTGAHLAHTGINKMRDDERDEKVGGVTRDVLDVAD